MDHQDNLVPHTTTGERKQHISDVDLDRWAQLVANGQVPFPQDMESHAQETLAGLVSAIRRQRLLKCIAHAIAVDIHRTRESVGKESGHAQANI